MLEETGSDPAHLAGRKCKQSEAEMRPDRLKWKAGLKAELREIIIISRIRPGRKQRGVRSPVHTEDSDIAVSSLVDAQVSFPGTASDPRRALERPLRGNTKDSNCLRTHQHRGYLLGAAFRGACGVIQALSWLLPARHK